MGGFLTEEQTIILQEAHHSCRNKKSADRIKAVLFLNEGFSYQQTARLLMLDDETIRRYRRHYEKEGVDGLLESRYIGSKQMLSKRQQLGLIQHLRSKTYLQVKDICVYVKVKYGKTYSVSGMTQYLHRQGFVYKKTKQIPGKADKEKQEVFIEQYKGLKESKSKEDRIYFLDATHPRHNSRVSYGWIYKGDVKTIKANTGRARMNLNGALNIEDMDITVLEEETVNAQSVLRLFKKLEKKQKEGDIYVIMDNARYNRNKVVKKYAQDHPRIKIRYLPSYSPNLNPIERLWHYFHKKVLYNQYYETLDEFEKTVRRFFITISKHNHELRNLLTDNFQTLPT